MSNSKVKMLSAKIANFLNTPTENLIRNMNNNRGGVLQFDELSYGFDEFKNILSYANSDALANLPYFKFNELDDRLTHFFNKIEVIQNLQKNPQQSDVQQKKDHISFFNNPVYKDDPSRSGFFATHKNEIWNIIAQSIAISNTNYKSEVEAKNILDNLIEFQDQAKQKNLQLDSILNSAQSELSKAGVEKHSDIFNSQALVHSKEASSWRKYSIILISLIVLIAFAFFIVIAFIISTEGRTVIIETSIFGALIISILSYSLSLCVKNYFAEKHNESVNRHKANCLGTFNTFIDSADEERKAAVLLHATQTIFSHQRSGFLSKDTDGSNPNPFIEVVRNISSK
ncbi:MAG TPA: hypothetical protein DEH15_19330 [Marinilabiliales bacterium]|nr:hypothetical protein [Marinilabiliales bacterium]